MSKEPRKRIVEKLNRMSYASFAYPKNEERVLYELQQTFRPGR